MSQINVEAMEYEKSFNQLSDQEKLYSYYLDKAIWSGAPISFFQISFESPILFIIFQEFFTSFPSLAEMKQKLLSTDSLTISDYNLFMKYALYFYENLGNYCSFGHSKLYPGITNTKFEEILKLSEKYSKIQPLWEKIKLIIYAPLSKLPEFSSSFKDEIIKGTYYLNGINKNEIEKIDSILNEKKISLINTRLKKINDKKFEVLIGSIIEKEEELIKNDEIEIILKYGDFKDYLIKMNNYLKEAQKYASNDLQKRMIDLYLKHFETGDINIHKDSQRLWVKDKAPVVEFNLGWIETYIDTFGLRAYYEGIVALKDKDATIKFKNLVDNVKYFLGELPWSSSFEKDNFILPDFTALDVIGFATTNLFIGINLPNYLDIHETDGFKNVSLSNAYGSVKIQNMLNFMNENDANNLVKMMTKVSTFKTALHELIGHGTGKLFTKNEKGEYNFDIDNLINPLTNEKIDTFYNKGETYENKFKTICRSFEEGRADNVALYLVFSHKAQEIFEFSKEEYEDVIYNMWLYHIYGAFIGITYCKGNNKWDSPYAREKYVFLNFLRKNQDKDHLIIKFDYNEQKNAVKIDLNKQNLLTYGKDLVSKILLNMHIWKCIGDYNHANEFFEEYSILDEEMMLIKGIIYSFTFQSKVTMNIDLVLDEKSNKVSISNYELDIEGYIQTFIDRYHNDFNEITYNLWNKYFE